MVHKKLLIMALCITIHTHAAEVGVIPQEKFSLVTHQYAQFVVETELYDLEHQQVRYLSRFELDAAFAKKSMWETLKHMMHQGSPVFLADQTTRKKAGMVLAQSIVEISDFQAITLAVDPYQKYRKINEIVKKIYRTPVEYGFNKCPELITYQNINGLSLASEPDFYPTYIRLGIMLHAMIHEQRNLVVSKKVIHCSRILKKLGESMKKMLLLFCISIGVFCVYADQVTQDSAEMIATLSKLPADIGMSMLKTVHDNPYFFIFTVWAVTYAKEYVLKNMFFPTVVIGGYLIQEFTGNLLDRYATEYNLIPTGTCEQCAVKVSSENESNA